MFSDTRTLEPSMTHSQRNQTSMGLSNIEMETTKLNQKNTKSANLVGNLTILLQSNFSESNVIIENVIPNCDRSNHKGSL